MDYMETNQNLTKLWDIPKMPTRYKYTQDQYNKDMAKEQEQKKRIFSKKKEFGITVLITLALLALFIFVI